MVLQCDVFGSVRVLPLHVLQLGGDFNFPSLARRKSSLLILASFRINPFFFNSDRLLRSSSAILAHHLEAVDSDVQVQNDLTTASKTIKTRAACYHDALMT